MLFNSLEFILFFPIVCLVYYLLPGIKGRTIFLLLASYYFYMCWEPVYALLLLTSTSITYISALCMDRFRSRRRRKISLFSGIFINLGILFFYKYYEFAGSLITDFFSLLNIGIDIPRWNVLLPVGISFYTFIALGYLIDVYRGRIKAEKDFIAFGTFVAFFPPLLSGPIERAENLLKQIKAEKVFNEERVLNGICRMLWGYFQKVVIADRIAVIVNAIYGNEDQYTGAYVLLATVLYAFQIYCDFAGYSNLAIGAAGVMGFELRENFNVPYKAVNISDFWDRWHISLSTWLRDYVYISLGGNRKGEWKKYRNLLITFLVSGIWHGVNWTFIVWGALHGVYSIVHNVLAKKCKSLAGKVVTGLKMVGTFLIVDFAWLFFRADSVKHALGLIKKIFVEFEVFSLLDREMAITMGLEIEEIVVLVIALLILVLVDFTKDVFSYREKIVKSPLVVRWIVFYVAIFVIIIFGHYGPGFEAGQFIYAQF